MDSGQKSPAWTFSNGVTDEEYRFLEDAVGKVGA
jgi:hypothetical protein